MTHYVVMDIVKHLRMNAEDFRYDNADDYASHGALMLSAADEIERLRDTLRITDPNDLLGRLQAAEADLDTKSMDLAARAEELEQAEALLREARDDIEDWAGYASEYFQEKHDLKGTLAKYDAWLARRKGE